MHLSQHFTLEELIVSATAEKNNILNFPNNEQVVNLARLCSLILEPLREAIGSKPLIVSSAFRNDKVNLLVGGAPNSYHTKGLAADIHYIDEDFRNKILSKAKTLNCAIEVIDEPTWLHIALNPKF